MASDKQVAVRKKGNVMSSFLVVAALIAAGGVGRFLWKYQASLDQESPAPVAAATAVAPEPAPVPQPVAQVTELLPVSPPAPKPKPVKPVRGDITIVGKNVTASSVAPPTREDLAAVRDGNGSTYDTWRAPSPGPKVYTPEDPNDRLPRPRHRSGDPRYYDYESNGFRGNPYDPAFQRRSTVIQRNTTN